MTSPTMHTTATPAHHSGVFARWFRLAELSEQALEKVRNKRARLALEGDRYVEAQDPLTDEE